MKLRRYCWMGLTWSSLGLATAGVFLPLLPTTPFLLLSAWSAAKVHPDWVARLHAHPHFGPHLRRWHKERSITGRAKALALLLLTANWLLLWYLSMPGWVLAVLAVIFASVAIYLIRLPQTSAAS